MSSCLSVFLQETIEKVVKNKPLQEEVKEAIISIANKNNGNKEEITSLDIMEVGGNYIIKLANGALIGLDEVIRNVVKEKYKYLPSKKDSKDSETSQDSTVKINREEFVRELEKIAFHTYNKKNIDLSGGISKKEREALNKFISSYGSFVSFNYLAETLKSKFYNLANFFIYDRKENEIELEITSVETIIDMFSEFHEDFIKYQNSNELKQKYGKYLEPKNVHDISKIPVEDRANVYYVQMGALYDAHLSAVAKREVSPLIAFYKYYTHKIQKPDFFIEAEKRKKSFYAVNENSISGKEAIQEATQVETQESIDENVAEVIDADVIEVQESKTEDTLNQLQEIAIEEEGRISEVLSDMLLENVERKPSKEVQNHLSYIPVINVTSKKSITNDDKKKEVYSIQVKSKQFVDKKPSHYYYKDVMSAMFELYSKAVELLEDGKFSSLEEAVKYLSVYDEDGNIKDFKLKKNKIALSFAIRFFAEQKANSTNSNILNIRGVDIVLDERDETIQPLKANTLLAEELGEEQGINKEIIKNFYHVVSSIHSYFLSTIETEYVKIDSYTGFYENPSEKVTKDKKIDAYKDIHKTILFLLGNRKTEKGETSFLSFLDKSILGRLSIEKFIEKNINNKDSKKVIIQKNGTSDTYNLILPKPLSFYIKKAIALIEKRIYEVNNGKEKEKEQEEENEENEEQEDALQESEEEKRKRKEDKKRIDSIYDYIFKNIDTHEGREFVKSFALSIRTLVGVTENDIFDISVNENTNEKIYSFKNIFSALLYSKEELKQYGVDSVLSEEIRDYAFFLSILKNVLTTPTIEAPSENQKIISIAFGEDIKDKIVSGKRILYDEEKKHFRYAKQGVDNIEKLISSENQVIFSLPINSVSLQRGYLMDDYANAKNRLYSYFNPDYVYNFSTISKANGATVPILQTQTYIDTLHTRAKRNLSWINVSIPKFKRILEITYNKEEAVDYKKMNAADRFILFTKLFLNDSGYIAFTPANKSINYFYTLYLIDGYHLKTLQELQKSYFEKSATRILSDSNLPSELSELQKKIDEKIKAYNQEIKGKARYEAKKYLYSNGLLEGVDYVFTAEDAIAFNPNLRYYSNEEAESLYNSNVDEYIAKAKHNHFLKTKAWEKKYIEDFKEEYKKLYKSIVGDVSLEKMGIYGYNNSLDNLAEDIARRALSDYVASHIEVAVTFHSPFDTATKAMKTPVELSKRIIARQLNHSVGDVSLFSFPLSIVVSEDDVYEKVHHASGSNQFSEVQAFILNKQNKERVVRDGTVLITPFFAKLLSITHRINANGVAKLGQSDVKADGTNSFIKGATLNLSYSLLQGDFSGKYTKLLKDMLGKTLYEKLISIRENKKEQYEKEGALWKYKEYLHRQEDFSELVYWFLSIQDAYKRLEKTNKQLYNEIRDFLNSIYADTSINEIEKTKENIIGKLGENYDVIDYINVVTTYTGFYAKESSVKSYKPFVNKEGDFLPYYVSPRSFGEVTNLIAEDGQITTIPAPTQANYVLSNDELLETITELQEKGYKKYQEDFDISYLKPNQKEKERVIEVKENIKKHLVSKYEAMGNYLKANAILSADIDILFPEYFEDIVTSLTNTFKRNIANPKVIGQRYAVADGTGMYQLLEIDGKTYTIEDAFRYRYIISKEKFSEEYINNIKDEDYKKRLQKLKEEYNTELEGTPYFLRKDIATKAKIRDLKPSEVIDKKGEVLRGEKLSKFLSAVRRVDKIRTENVIIGSYLTLLDKKNKIQKDIKSIELDISEYQKLLSEKNKEYYNKNLKGLLGILAKEKLSLKSKLKEIESKLNEIEKEISKQNETVKKKYAKIISSYNFIQEHTITPFEVVLPFEARDLFNLSSTISLRQADDYLKRTNPTLHYYFTKYINNAVATRIPTSALSSIQPIRIVAFANNVNNVAIVSNELLYISGADTDGDTLSVEYIDIASRIKKNKGVAIKEDDNVESKLAVLSNPINFIKLLTPIDNSLLEAKASQERSKEDNSFEEKYGFFNSFTKVKSQIQNLSALSLVGIFVKFNQIYSYYSHLIKKDSSLMELPELTFNGKTYNQFSFYTREENPELISEIINKLVNSALDDSKFNFSGVLNINTVTANWINILLTYGVPFKEIIEFINKPFIKQIVKEMRNAGGIYEDTSISKEVKINSILLAYENRAKAQKDKAIKKEQESDIALIRSLRVRENILNDARKIVNLNSFKSDVNSYVDTLIGFTKYINPNASSLKDFMDIDIEAKTVNRENIHFIKEWKLLYEIPLYRNLFSYLQKDMFNKSKIFPLFSKENLDFFKYTHIFYSNRDNKTILSLYISNNRNFTKYIDFAKAKFSLDYVNSTFKENEEKIVSYKDLLEKIKSYQNIIIQSIEKDKQVKEYFNTWFKMLNNGVDEGINIITPKIDSRSLDELENIMAIEQLESLQNEDFKTAFLHYILLTRNFQKSYKSLTPYISLSMKEKLSKFAKGYTYFEGIDVKEKERLLKAFFLSNKYIYAPSKYYYHNIPFFKWKQAGENFYLVDNDKYDIHNYLITEEKEKPVQTESVRKEEEEALASEGEKEQKQYEEVVTSNLTEEEKAKIKEKEEVKKIDVYYPKQIGSAVNPTVPRDPVNMNTSYQLAGEALLTLGNNWHSEAILSEAIDFIANQLRKLGVEVIIENDPNLSYKGKLVGDVKAGGKIYLNKANLTLDTPFHELSHVDLILLSRLNPKLYKQLEEVAMKLPLYNKVYERYKHLYGKEDTIENMNRVANEVLAELLGYYVAKEFERINRLSNDTSLISRLLSVLSEVYNAIVSYIRPLVFGSAVRTEKDLRAFATNYAKQVVNGTIKRDIDGYIYIGNAVYHQANQVKDVRSSIVGLTGKAIPIASKGYIESLQKIINEEYFINQSTTFLYNGKAHNITPELLTNENGALEEFIKKQKKETLALFNQLNTMPQAKIEEEIEAISKKIESGEVKDPNELKKLNYQLSLLSVFDNYHSEVDKILIIADGITPSNADSKNPLYKAIKDSGYFDSSDIILRYKIVEIDGKKKYYVDIVNTSQEGLEKPYQTGSFVNTLIKGNGNGLIGKLRRYLSEMPIANKLDDSPLTVLGVENVLLAMYLKKVFGDDIIFGDMAVMELNNANKIKYRNILPNEFIQSLTEIAKYANTAKIDIFPREIMDILLDKKLNKAELYASNYLEKLINFYRKNKIVGNDYLIKLLDSEKDRYNSVSLLHAIRHRINHLRKLVGDIDYKKPKNILEKEFIYLVKAYNTMANQGKDAYNMLSDIDNLEKYLRTDIENKNPYYSWLYDAYRRAKMIAEKIYFKNVEKRRKIFSEYFKYAKMKYGISFTRYEGKYFENLFKYIEVENNGVKERFNTFRLLNETDKEWKTLSKEEKAFIEEINKLLYRMLIESVSVRKQINYFEAKKIVDNFYPKIKGLVPLLRSTTENALFSGDITGAFEASFEKMSNRANYFNEENKKEYDELNLYLYEQLMYGDENGTFLRKKMLGLSEEGYDIKQNKKLSIDLLDILNYFDYNLQKKKMMDEVSDMWHIARSLMKIREAETGISQKNNLELLDTMIKKKLYGERLKFSETKLANTIERTLLTINNLSSYLALGFNYSSNIKAFLANTMAIVVKTLGNKKDVFTIKELTRATKEVASNPKKALMIAEEMGFVNSIDMERILNKRISGTSQSIMGNVKVSADIPFIGDALGDYMNKLTVMVAQMIKDGTYDAMSIEEEDGNIRIKYDRNKDKRHPDLIKFIYQKQVQEGLVAIGEEMYLPYDIAGINRLDTIINRVSGSLTEASETLAQTTVIGKALTKFKLFSIPYINSIFRQTGYNFHYKTVTYKDGQVEEIMPYEESVFRTLLKSIGYIHNFGIGKGIEIIKENMSEEQKNNLLNAAINMVSLGLLLILRKIMDDDEENKKRKRLYGRDDFAYRLLNDALNDISMFGIFNMGLNANIASISILKRFANALWAILTLDLDKGTIKLINSIGLLNSIETMLRIYDKEGYADYREELKKSMKRREREYKEYLGIEEEE